MNKLKIFIFLIILVFLTGCDANYTLTITENSMIESVDFVIDDSAENEETLKTYMDMKYSSYYDMDARKTHYYKQTKLKEDNKIGMNLTYEYADDNLQKSSLLDRCYYKKDVIKTDEYIIITTDEDVRCLNKDGEKLLDSLTINIKTDLKVLENNADEIKGNTYTWYINQKNMDNKPINIKISLEKPFNYTFLIILGAILGLGIIAIIYVFLKGKQNNKL